jgi:hypothetical protein
MIKKLYFYLALFLFTSTVQAATLNVGTNYDDCAICGTSSFYNTLQSSTNFGSVGSIVPDRTFNIQNLGSGFTAANLSSTDIFIASSKESYTAAQATSLYNFVLGGGNLFVYSDFSPTDVANINPVANLFGVVYEDAFEIFAFAVQPGANFVTDGPFSVGSTVTYNRDAVSHITNLGSNAVSVAQENPTSINSALIAEGVLGSGSGAVLFYSDWVTDVFDGGYVNASGRNIILNFFANVSSNSRTEVPEPSSLLLFATAIALLALFRPRKIKSLGGNALT